MNPFYLFVSAVAILGSLMVLFIFFPWKKAPETVTAPVKPQQPSMQHVSEIPSISPQERLERQIAAYERMVGFGTDPEFAAQTLGLILVDGELIAKPRNKK